MLRQFVLTSKQTVQDDYGKTFQLKVIFMFMFELKACWNNLFGGLHGVWQMRYEGIKGKDGLGPISSEEAPRPKAKP